MKILPYLMLSLMVVLSSCKKDKQNNNNPSSLLTAAPWKPALTDKNTGTNPQGDKIYYAWLSCNNDDSYSFGNNGTLIINNGRLNCTSDETASVQSNYTIDLNANTITIKGVGYHLAELSSTQLKYYVDVPQTSGFTHLIYIYEH